MKQFFQNITAFTKRERRGAYLLVLILVALIIINRNISYLSNEEPWFITSDTVQVSQWLRSMKSRQLKLKSFNPNKVDIQDLIQMGLPASICSNWIKYLDAGGKFYSKSEVKRLYGMVDSIFYKIEPYLIISAKRKYYSAKVPSEKSSIKLSDFDPNTYSLKQLTKAGLKESVAKNIINYRKNSSGYDKKEDLKKLYAISNELYSEIEPYIKIAKRTEQIVRLDSVELNSTTYEELVELGISKKAAKSILGYRNILGGFYNQHQLTEVYDIDKYSLQLLSQSSWIDTLLIRRINMNEIDERKLTKHPYISKLQARKLIQYKNFASKVDNFQEIMALNIFSRDLASKLRIYFAF